MRYKHNYHRYFFIVLLSSLPFASCAQKSTWGTGNAIKKSDKAKHKLKDFKDNIQNWGLDTSFAHTFLIGGKLNSDGWSGSICFMKKRSPAVTNLWQVMFSEIKHEKQAKQTGTNGTFTQLGNPSPYVFGKINNLYTLQVGFGKEQLLLPAVMEGNISVSFRYSAGVSVAMLKPYYLKLIYVDHSTAPETAFMEEHKFTAAIADTFLNKNSILGASAWNKSLPEIEYVPGGYFETALAILPGKNKTFVQSITLGINGAIYAQKLPIMADLNAYPWQVCLFAGLAIGKRWK